MANFRGETVLVTLKEPKDAQVRGLVIDVVNQQLNLKDVTWLPSQERTDYLVIDGRSNLLDLEIAAPETHFAVPEAILAAVPDTQETLPGADDPAIVSYGRPMHKSSAVSSFTQQETRLSADAGGSSFTQSEQDAVAGAGQGTLESSVPPPAAIPASTQEPFVHEQGPTSATLTGPFEELELNDKHVSNGNLLDQEAVDGKGEEAMAVSGSKLKKKRPKKAMRRELLEKATAVHAYPQRQGKEASPESRKKTGQPRKNSGWRETPFLEEAPKYKTETAQPSNGQASKGQRQRQRKNLAEDQNGWATEDATDIQEMGDFDFSGNLSKFDKHGTFTQFRQEDTTADEERLVTHNRLPARPGTAGGKNLHYTENVLSPKVNQAAWNSDDSENDITDAQFGSGRSSHRNRSQASVRQPPSRKSSVMTSEQHMTGSGSLPEPKVKPRPKFHEPIDDHEHVDKELSSGIIRHASRQAEKTLSRVSSTTITKPAFRFTSKLLCPCLTPLQMLELEQLAQSELGLTEDVLTENAARGIIDIINQSALTKLKCEGSEASANVIILAGNNKTGARAIAAARQGLNHPSNIILTILGHNRDEDLLEPVRRQLNIYRKCGGQLMKPDQLTTLSKNARFVPDVIIDALLGMHTAYDDLTSENQETYLTLADWANNATEYGSTLIASIDIPSGLDPSSGMPH